MSTHSKYGGSTAERYLNCPGSIALCEKAPSQPPGPYAEEGTRAHEALEAILREALKKPEFSSFKSYFTKEMINHANQCRVWVEAKITKLPGSELLIEEKVDASSFTRPGNSGTVDFAIVQPFGRLAVGDYKYGKGYAVEITDEDDSPNSQLVYYALGLLEKYDWNFSEVEIVIYQPRAYHKDGPVRSLVIAIEDMRIWQDVFRDGVALCESPKAKLNPNPRRWCKFCPAKAICPAISKGPMRDAALVFDDEKGLEEIPRAVGLRPEEIGVALIACEKIALWEKELKDLAKSLLTTGTKIPGWKLVNGKGRRVWGNPEATQKAAQRQFGWEAFTKPELMTPAQVEMNCSTEENAKEFVEKYSTKVAGGLVLVPESNKRKAVNPIEEAFPDYLDSPCSEECLDLPEKTAKTKGVVKSKKLKTKKT